MTCFIIFLALASLLIQAAILFVVRGISEELRRHSDLLVRQQPPLVRVQQDASLVLFKKALGGGTVSFVAGTPPTTYAVWAWRGTCWELDLGSVPPGYEPVGPPNFNGTFGGQRVKKECVPC